MIIRFLRKTEVKIRYSIWSYRRLSYPTTSDRINYQGSEGYCINGVNSPMWLTDLSDKRIHENTFLVLRCRKRDWCVFKQRYNFQMTSWYSIDYRNKLFSRISYHSSNDIYFKTKL